MYCNKIAGNSAKCKIAGRCAGRTHTTTNNKYNNTHTGKVMFKHQTTTHHNNKVMSTPLQAGKGSARITDITTNAATRNEQAGW